AAAASFHVWIAGPHEAQRGDGAGYEALHDILVGDRQQRPQALRMHIGVIDQDVHASERLHGLIDHPLYVVTIVRIASDRKALAAATADLLAGIEQFRRRTPEHGDGRTLGGQRQCYSASDALSGACDDCESAIKLSHTLLRYFFSGARLRLGSL